MKVAGIDEKMGTFQIIVWKNWTRIKTGNLAVLIVKNQAAGKREDADRMQNIKSAPKTRILRQDIKFTAL